MKKIYKHFSIFVLIIAIILVVSGCGRKSPENLTPALSLKEREKTSPLLTSKEGEQATSSSETAETATSTEDVDTADWKVYKNEEYGFELKYPRGWEYEKKVYEDDVEDTGLKLEFSNNKRYYLEFSARTLENAKNLDKMINEPYFPLYFIEVPFDVRPLPTKRLL